MGDTQRTVELAQTRLDSISLPQGGWTVEARAAALVRLQSQGLPARRDEYWRYTRPDTLTIATAPSAAPEPHSEDGVFEHLDALKIVFVDGIFDPQASDDLNLDGITIERLATAAEFDIHWAKPIYGSLEAAGQTPVARPLAAFNTAQASDGILIDVKSTPSKPVSVIYRHKDAGSDVTLHHVVKVAEDAKLELLVRCSPDESNIPIQPCAGAHGIPILLRVRLTRLWLDNRVAVGWQQVLVSSEYPNSRLKSAAVGPLLQLFQSLPRDLLLCRDLVLVLFVTAYVQHSQHEASHLVGVL